MGTIPALADCDPGLRATGYNVLVAVEPAEDVTRGGILIPDSVRDKEAIVQTRGRIVSVGPVAFGYDTFPVGTSPQIGDAVIFAKLAGIRIPRDSTKDGREYRLIDDKAVSAILEETVHG